MTQQTKVSGVATNVFTDEQGALCVRYHQTVVARKVFGRIELNTGGWRTATTKTRMNQFANQHCGGLFSVFQKDHDWFVRVNGKDFGFDGDKCVVQIA